jgi:predicted nucleotidyltransferase component of viral defense system
MNNIFEQMLSAYDLSTTNLRRNAIYEVLQQVALSGLYRSGFFDKAAFYGGTCLRIFHGMPRFSEDMDFTLLNEDSSFHLEDYFQPLIDSFEMVGRKVTITRKEKHNESKVESAFLKDNTDVYHLTFQTEKSIKVKLEVDIHPPLCFQTEQKLLLQPFSFMTRCMTLPCLYAGKMHALVFRAWGQRVKGRDWYDFEWYVRHGIPLDFKHLCARAKEFNGLELTKELFEQMLVKRLAHTDIEIVKKDILPFVKNSHDMDIWSNDYFVQLAGMINYC